jgi:hypothetical protein
MFFTPFVGTNFTINSNDNSAQNFNTPNDDFQFAYPSMHYADLQPLTLGFLLDYQNNKHRFSSGFIYNDGAGSTMKYGITVPNTSNAFSNVLYATGGVWSAGSIAKIPFNYSYKIIAAQHIGNNKKFFDVRIRGGLNWVLRKKWREDGVVFFPFTENGENAIIRQPHYFFYTNIDGDIAGFVSWQCNLQKGWSVSFNAGFDIDWYIKNKRRITTSFYFEQGTRNVSAIVNQIYFNGAYQGSNIIYSRGSAIQFKLAFPLEVLKKYTLQKSEN